MRRVMFCAAFIAAAVSALFVSCDNKGTDDPFLEVSTDPVAFTSTGGSKKIPVRTNVENWDVKSDQDWCRASRVGSDINLVAPVNNSLEDMPAATVTVTAGALAPVTITVTQSAGTATLTVKPSDPINFTSLGGTSVAMSVTTNNPTWTAESDQTWAKVNINKENNTFTVSAESHESQTAPAAATVTVSAGTATPVTIAVTQDAYAGPTLEVTPSADYNFAATGGTTNAYTIRTNQTSWDAVSDKSWLSVTKSGDSFTLTAAEAGYTVPETATVTVTAGTAEPVTFKVTQERKRYRGELQVTSGGRDYTIIVALENVPYPEDPNATNPDFKYYSGYTRQYPVGDGKTIDVMSSITTGLVPNADTGCNAYFEGAADDPVTGKTKWRLPNREELNEVVSKIFNDDPYGYDLQSTFDPKSSFFTSLENEGKPDEVWLIKNDGWTRWGTKYYWGYARCVRELTAE